jgi:hypothetical protein
MSGTSGTEAAVEIGFSSRRRALLDTFVPEALLPEQYFDRRLARSLDSPEQRLLFAVLLDSVIQLQGHSEKDAAEAARWVRGVDGDEDWPFSFQNICGALGIEADYLARGLLSWRTRKAAMPYRGSLRQVRTSHTHVAPPRQRQRRRGLVLAR